MDELEETFLEFSKSGFGEYVSDVYVKLRENNPEYQELRKEKEEILTSFPKLRGVLEDRDEVELSKEEVKALSEIIDIYLNMSTIQEWTLFLTGIKESYYFLKKLEMLKD